MTVPNLTRAQAAQRAGLVEVDSYAVDLDLTDGAGRPGEGTFRSTTTVRFSCTRPGEASWIDLVAAGIRAATLNGAALDVAGYDEAAGIALPELAADNELVVEADRVGVDLDQPGALRGLRAGEVRDGHVGTSCQIGPVVSGMAALPIQSRARPAAQPRTRRYDRQVP